MRFQVTLLIALMAYNSTSFAANNLKELRIANQLKDHIVIGSVEWLALENNKFMALFAETETDSQKAVILVHGMGAHPNWPNVIEPLRTKLPIYGWSTLSIQSPVLSSKATFNDYLETLEETRARIDKSIEFLEELKVKDIILIGHSFGAYAIMDYVANTEAEPALINEKPRIHGLIAISLTGQKKPSGFNPLDTIEKVTLPVLEIYGGSDFADVKDTLRAKRLAAIRAGNKNYRQSKVSDANHYYSNSGGTLIKKARGWMKKIITAANKQPTQ
ncbi:MAG: DUF3530 family protein [Methylococcales bacterium]|jgi:pimeloyl-ACP methyl ester carboxylesterase|nr:DUF3530 family protein [Methylococcales bacterium]MBT7444074.1 DUF3530 family protein [Methylococcales bacterium]